VRERGRPLNVMYFTPSVLAMSSALVERELAHRVRSDADLQRTATARVRGVRSSRTVAGDSAPGTRLSTGQAAAAPRRAEEAAARAVGDHRTSPL